MGTRVSRNLLALAVTVSVTAILMALPAEASDAAATASEAPAAASDAPAAASASVEASASAQAEPAAVLGPEGRLIETGDGLRIDWTRGMLTMTGIGFSPDRGTLSQRRALAHQTAVTDGARRLYEAVNQLRVNGNAFVRDLTAVDESLRAGLYTRLAALPAKAVKPWPDGSVEVEFELSFWGEDSLSALMAQAVTLSASPSAGPVASEPSALVVDGRGTGAQPALALSLKDETGQLLYQGPVTYFHAPEALAEVAGKKPVQLKARRAVGATRADLTLRAEEAEAFRKAREQEPDLPVVVLL